MAARRLTLADRYRQVEAEMNDIYREIGRLKVEEMDRQNAPTVRNMIYGKLRKAGYDVQRLRRSDSLDSRQQELLDQYYTQLKSLRSSVRKKYPGWLGNLLETYEAIRKSRKNG